MTQPSDLSIRYFVYQYFVEHSRPPSTSETAQAFGFSEGEAQAAYERLNEGHFFFLQPGTTQIRMANPFSALPTPFSVHIEGKSYWANCAWDMLGIPAALGKDAVIEARFEQTEEQVFMRVTEGNVQHDGGVVHFPLPFHQWYDDLVFT